MQKPAVSPWWRRFAILFGVAMILVGAADVVTRLSERVLGSNVSLFAFAPAAVIADPSLLSAIEGVSTTTPFVPTVLHIPSLGVHAPVEAVGKQQDGAMATPRVFSDVSWYKLGSKPNGQGNAVFAGHVNNALTTAGVFAHLSQIKIGDSIVVEGAGGIEQKYVVSRLDRYPKDKAPNGEIFTTKGPSQVVLITCDGEWDSVAHSFDERLVVVAQKAPL